MLLHDIIIDRIQTEGTLSFRNFMEMALYYPGLGYYTSGEDKIGKNGDYYTSPHYTSLFGQTIAKQLEEMWHKLGREPFTIVEYGAGNGMLCNDILTELCKNSELFDQLKYCVIEKGSSFKKRKAGSINDKVNCYDNIREILPFDGCVLSNELIDNLPVHQVVMKNELMEVFVGYENGFVEILKPASPELKNYFTELDVVLPEGFRTEINLEAINWIQDIAAVLQKGFVLTIDYGYSSSNLYQESRNCGTLVCYHKHQVNNNYYQSIGSQDITAHVNFSALKHWGLKNELQYCGFTNQAYFLLGLGLSMQARLQNIEGDASRFLQTFLLDMGSKLKVLIQQKGVTESKLSGLNFSQQLI